MRDGLQIQQKSIESFQMSSMAMRGNFVNRNDMPRHDANGQFSILDKMALNRRDSDIHETVVHTGLLSTAINNYTGGILDPSGRYVYFVPLAVSQILKIDSDDNSYTFIGSLGSASFKWSCGVLHKEQIYCFSQSSDSGNRFLIIDTENDALSFIPTGGINSNSGILASNGKIYCCPVNQPFIQVLNPVTETSEYIGLGTSFSAYGNGLVEYEGYIYMFPRVGAAIVTRISIKDHSVKFIPVPNFGFNGAALAPNGLIYGCPWSTDTLVFDPTTEKSFQLGTIGSGSTKWSGIVLGYNSKLYGIPFGLLVTTLGFLEIDPNDNSQTTIGNNVASDSSGGVMVRNGVIYCAPRRNSGIKVINTQADKSRLDINHSYVVNRNFNKF